MINKSSSNKYVFNYEDILVEAKTGAKRKLIDYRKNPPQPYNTKKFQVMFGILIVSDLKWKNMKIIPRKSLKHY